MTQVEQIREDTKNYRNLFLENVQFFDVRAPVEFNKGSVPGAVNLPLMTDSEREAVGIAYKKEGQAAAVALGNALVQGGVRNARVSAWVEFAEKHPQGYLFCMRGGLRSQISQRWMGEAGSPYPLVTGGYKAMRRFLIEETERLVANTDFTVVAGRTGTGKTDFLHAVSGSLDLEGLAGHRGSSFGRRLSGQPSQINFENMLAVRLMKLTDPTENKIFVEDEGRRIGALEIPPLLADKMAAAAIIMVVEPLEERVALIYRDYVASLSAEYDVAYGDKGVAEYGAFLLSALARIKKRLGGVRYHDIQTLMQAALNVGKTQASEALHRDWIRRLLTDYYDPMYEYQLANHSRKTLFTGSRSEAVEWSQSNQR